MEIGLMMPRALISRAWTRGVKSVNTGRYSSTSTEQGVKTRPRGDSEFVKRRRSYEKDMHELRIAFASEHTEAELRARESKSADQTSLEGVAEARAARKRKKSIARQAEHLARLKEVQEKKKERTEYKRRDWEERWGKIIDGRMAVADLLAEHCDDWITKETIDEHVERAIDEFFIVGAHQKREVKEMVEG